MVIPSGLPMMSFRVYGLIGHNWNWITGLVDCQAGPDATDLWGRRQQMLAFLSRTLRTFSRCPPETAVVSDSAYERSGMRVSSERIVRKISGGRRIAAVIQ